MQLQNAIKKLASVAVVNNNGCQYYADLNGQVVSFCENGGGSNTAICFHVKRKGEQSDSMSDYFPGSYFPTLTSAIKSAQRA